MLTDKTCLFFENEDSEFAGKLDLNGHACGEIFCTINGTVSAVTLTVKTADNEDELASAPVLFTHAATAEDIKKGLTSCKTSWDFKHWVSVTASVTGTPAEVEEGRTGVKVGGLTCGYVPMAEHDGYLHPEMAARIK